MGRRSNSTGRGRLFPGRGWRARVLSLLLALLIVLAGKGALTQDLTFSGIAVDSLDQPLQNILITLENAESQQIFAVSSQTGQFSVMVPQYFLTETFSFSWRDGTKRLSTALSLSRLESSSPFLVRLSAPDPKGSLQTKLRTHFFTLNEIAASVLLTGFVPPEVKGFSLLADKNLVILRTPAFDYGKKILDRFGNQLVEEYFSSSSNHEYSMAPGREPDSESITYLVDAYGSKAEVERSYRGLYVGDDRNRRIFIPDLAAVRTLTEGHRFPSNFSYVFSDFELDTDSTIWSRPPKMARDMTNDDIVRYVEHEAAMGAAQNLGKWLATARTALTWGTIDDLKPLLFITGGKSFPPGFMPVYQTWGPSGCDEAYWHFEAEARILSVEAIVIENISGDVLRIGEFLGRRFGAEGQVQVPAHGGASGSPVALDLFPQGLLGPNEALVVPLALNMIYDRGDEDDEDEYYEPKGRLVDIDYLRSLPPDALIRFHSGIRDERLYDCTVRSVLDTQPLQSAYVPDSVTIGPWLEIDQVRVEGEEFALRAELESTASVSGGVGAGSCPFLLFHDEATGLWINQGPILVGAVGQSLGRTEVVEIPMGVRRVRILEREIETTFLKGIALVQEHHSVLALSALSHRVPSANLPAAGAAKPIKLDKNEFVEIDLSVLPSFDDTRPNQLAIYGYYLPHN